MTDAEIARLRELAGAATPGAWTALLADRDGHWRWGGRVIGEGRQVATCLVLDDAQCKANAEYIAAASPMAILALLREREALYEWAADEVQKYESCTRELARESVDGALSAALTFSPDEPSNEALEDANTTLSSAGLDPDAVGARMAEVAERAYRAATEPAPPRCEGCDDKGYLLHRQPCPDCTGEDKP